MKNGTFGILARAGTLPLIRENSTPDSGDALSRDILLAKYPKWTLAHWCILITAASFLLLTLLPEGRLNDLGDVPSSEAVLVARSLAANGTFANPFVSMKTGVTAHVAPAYPFLYSLVLRALGPGHAALQVAWACNVAFFALQMGLLPLLSARLQFGILPGIVAAFLGTVSLYSPIDTRWESFLAGLLLMLAFLGTQRALHSRGWTIIVATGALWGVLILTNPVAILLLAAWPICWIWSQPRPQRGTSLARAAIMVVLALSVVTPWIARNYARFGSFIFVRSCFGTQLQNANNTCASPTLQETIQSGCHATVGPNVSIAVASQFAALGEVQFNRMKVHEALRWINTNRAAFFVLTLKRFRLFWFPATDSVWETVAVWTITLFSLAGWWLMRRKTSQAAVFAATWLLFPLIYYLSPFEARYRYPIFWTSLLPASYALLALLRCLPFFSRTSLSPRLSNCPFPPP